MEQQQNSEEKDKLDFKKIYNGWMNSLNYDKLSQSEKDIINHRAKICMGDPEKGIPKCENFVYSVVYHTIEKIIHVPHMIKRYLQNKGVFEKILDPKGRTREKRTYETTNEVIGGNGFKCKGCGCDFAAGISEPSKICPLSKW